MLYLVLAATDRLEAAEEKASGWLKFILDNPLAIAITLLLALAVMAAFLAARRRDRCLKKFRGFLVTVRQLDGHSLWGRLKVFSKGLELVYGDSPEDPTNRSFLIYESELPLIFTIHRYVDHLEGMPAARRRHQARIMVRLRLPTRIWRGIRNILNTFRDAVVQALGLSLQQVTKTTPNPLLTAAPGTLTTLGSTVLGEAARAYEPILEQYIGNRVVLELANPTEGEKRRTTHLGHLGEYSDKYILLLGVRERLRERVPLGEGPKQLLEGGVRLRLDEDRIVIENNSPVAVTVEMIDRAGSTYNIQAAVPPHETQEVDLPAGVRPSGAVAVLSYERTFDLIVPRTCGTVRHAAAE
jgi:small nuclear ribonucleoprotein (snRNP)-like protein